MNIVAQGLHEGWYQPAFGEVQKVEQTTNHQLITHIRGTNGVKGQLQLKADFIIDATGLESKIDANPLLKDLLDHYQLERNVLGRLKVTNDFEVAGMQNDEGRMFASGAMTLGGPYAAVDSFLGLQFAALRSVDAMVALGAPGLHYLDGWRSLMQWVRWMKGVKP
jgi:lysine/ornithine N-monooxygenase